MNLLTDILTFVGFFAITFGAAGTISRWIRESEERKRAAASHNAAVRESLNRIEATLKQQSKTSQP
jgi:hypothetical protein